MGGARVAGRTSMMPPIAAPANVSRPMPSRPLVGPPPHIRRRRARFAMAIVLLLAITIGAIGWWLGSGRYTDIPTVVGQDQAAAIDLLQEAGLDPDCCEKQFSETVKAGVVISADPATGEAVRGSDVHLVVSQGAERFEVPTSLVGKPADDVTAQLQDSVPVQITTKTDFSDTMKKGLVISFDPPAGTDLKRDQVVTMVVSAGRAPVAVPDVVGQSPEQAKSNLEKLGFTVKRTEDGRSDKVDVGEVMSMNPNPAGGPVAYGSTVTIRVSEGVPQVKIPDVRGKKGTEAKKILEDLGLVVEAEKFFGNRVVVQDPPAGQTVDKGSTIKILLN
jgi:eukaryotic-like serine/threonine-protein kinase